MAPDFVVSDLLLLKFCMFGVLIIDYLSKILFRDFLKLQIFNIQNKGPYVTRCPI
jgi:hypothetical protein